MQVNAYINTNRCNTLAREIVDFPGFGSCTFIRSRQFLYCSGGSNSLLSCSKSRTGEWNPATAVECLVYLAARNVNIRRCIAKGLEYVCRRIPVDKPAPLYGLNGRTGPLQSDEFTENHKDSTQRKKTNSQVDNATQASSQESLVQRRQQCRREDRKKRLSHIETMIMKSSWSQWDTVYDPIQFEPRKF